MAAFVKYTGKYRRDKLQTDLQALRKPTSAELRQRAAKEAEKDKLEARLAKKKQALEMKKAKKQRATAAIAAATAAPAAETGKVATSAKVPEPPKQPRKPPAVGGGGGGGGGGRGASSNTPSHRGRIIHRAASPLPGADKTTDDDYEEEEEEEFRADAEAPNPLNTSQPLSQLYTPPSSRLGSVISPAASDALAAALATRSSAAAAAAPTAASVRSARSMTTISISAGTAASMVKKAAAPPRLRSFELTVASTSSPSGDGPAGAELFEGYRRVYVRARSVQALLDGETRTHTHMHTHARAHARLHGRSCRVFCQRLAGNNCWNKPRSHCMCVLSQVCSPSSKLGARIGRALVWWLATAGAGRPKWMRRFALCQAARRCGW
eukprot:COSAG06_NODE_3111_length_5843_cov_21.693942_2_plen_380_part_00